MPSNACDILYTCRSILINTASLRLSTTGKDSHRPISYLQQKDANCSSKPIRQCLDGLQILTRIVLAMLIPTIDMSGTSTIYNSTAS